MGDGALLNKGYGPDRGTPASTGQRGQLLSQLKQHLQYQRPSASSGAPMAAGGGQGGDGGGSLRQTSHSSLHEMLVASCQQRPMMAAHHLATAAVQKQQQQPAPLSWKRGVSIDTACPSNGGMTAMNRPLGGSGNTNTSLPMDGEELPIAVSEPLPVLPEMEADSLPAHGSPAFSKGSMQEWWQPPPSPRRSQHYVPAEMVVAEASSVSQRDGAGFGAPTAGGGSSSSSSSHARIVTEAGGPAVDPASNSRYYKVVIISIVVRTRLLLLSPCDGNRCPLQMPRRRRHSWSTCASCWPGAVWIQRKCTALMISHNDLTF